jgi:hypothetical protein
MPAFLTGHDLAGKPASTFVVMPLFPFGLIFRPRVLISGSNHRFERLDRFDDRE